ncbi:2-hydroxychromene-2-carboxylate isomerase [Alcaligenaceae bacterium]|nr:2-hydroxychromene-2-carboxylate isomerase [Alcaligenaceae bacterium]
MKAIEYYFSPSSPWAYMGHERLLQLAARHGAQVEPRPFALGAAIFPISGGLPLKQRAPQRQAYRLVELRRWSEHLGVPLNIHPKHFPVSDDEQAALMVAAAINVAGNDAALRLLGAIYRALWAEDRDTSDPGTLIGIAGECRLDGQALYAARDEARRLYDQYTQQAIERQVFGAPWYVYKGEPFWGQDRLEFLERALARD